MTVSLTDYTILAIVLEGFGSGAIYATAGSALSMCMGSIRVPNMALPYFVMMGAYMVVWLTNGLAIGFFPALVIGFLIFAPMFLVLDRFIFARFYNDVDPATTYLVITLGIFTGINGLFDTVINANPVSLVTPFQDIFINLGPLVEPSSFLIYMALEYGLLAFMFFFIRSTRYGRAFRAMAQNRAGAALMGVDMKRMSTFAFFLSMSIAALAGMVYALGYSFDPTLGLGIMGASFAIVFVGGRGSILGAMLLGISFGFIEALVTLFINGVVTVFFFYGLLFIVLLLKPEGVFTR